MTSGVVGALRQNKKGGWYVHIREDATGEEVYYKLQDGEENTLREGMRVSFETSAGLSGAKRRSAYDVREYKGKPPLPRREARPADTRPSGREADTDAEYYLPQDTTRLLFASAGVVIENAALYTQKYLRVYREKSKKLKVLYEQPYSDAEKKLLDSLIQTQLDVLLAFKHGYSVSGKLEARLAIGLGTGSVLETSICLHHVYGFPYIPGSAVKGSVRSFLIREAFGGEEEDALADDAFAKAFGTQERRGDIVFLDAFPSACDRLKLDIMNPHYAQYYQGSSAPSDDMKPNPIKFYTVDQGARFTFRLASNALPVEDAVIAGRPLPAWLRETLMEIGIGAKTAAGYGWFGDVRGKSEKARETAGQA